MLAIDTKKTITTFFEHLTAGRFDEAFAKVDDNVAWWVPGNLPFSGTKNKAQYMGIVKRIQSAFPQGLRLEVKDMIAEGPFVAAEVESHGKHSNGKIYNNHYHFLFTFKGDTIVAVKEYMDTQHLHDLISG